MKKNEWYLIPLWLIALVLVALRMFTPGLLPERVEWLPYLLVAICCGRNLAAAAPAFNPGCAGGGKKKSRSGTASGCTGASAVSRSFFCFVFYMEGAMCSCSGWP